MCSMLGITSNGVTSGRERLSGLSRAYVCGAHQAQGNAHNLAISLDAKHFPTVEKSLHPLQAQGRAPHSPRESVMQYGVLLVLMAGQVSVPGPYTGLLNASFVPGCAPSTRAQVMHW